MGHFHNNDIKITITIANIYMQLTLMYHANLFTHINTYIFIPYLIPQYPSDIDTDMFKRRKVKPFTSKSYG